MQPTLRKNRSEKDPESNRAVFPESSTPAQPPFERHYSVEEIAEKWGLSIDFVRRLFLREAGVVVFWRQQPGKRVYRTLRIPESVVQRVHRRMTKR